MVTMSLCMIVKNEEQALGRCLSSVQGLFDEIIIVDTGSTDRTKEIAASYTSHIYPFDWIQDFSAARNYSFSLAAQDYIMWLDADDWLREADLDKLKALKQTLDPGIDAVSMDYLLAFDPMDQPTAVIQRIRLVKRSKGFRWVDPVHEWLEAEGNLIYAAIAVCHARMHTSADRNLQIYEHFIAQGGSLTKRQAVHYAMELSANGRYERAIDMYRTLIEDPAAGVEDKLDCCDRMAHCYHELGRKEQELQALMQTFIYDSPRADYMCRIAYCFQEEGHYEQAADWYLLALKLEKPTKQMARFNPAAWTWIPHLQLALCFGKLGQLELAYEHNEIALSYKPDDKNLLDNKQVLEQYLSNRK
jgi:Glycosyltransferases involved in cell wall biogenesis